MLRRCTSAFLSVAGWCGVVLLGVPLLVVLAAVLTAAGCLAVVLIGLPWTAAALIGETKTS
ncbi:MAG: hypothetical protein A2V98_04875 [Planctomycetes bacterium RBG_16_64_12]|nr:MAG: hypothetical protein A2V98_04875 [Planctomycetes bacterium RBG_16_64_12]